MRNIFLIVFVLCSIALNAQGVYFGGSIGYGLMEKSINHTDYNFSGSEDKDQGNFGTGFVPNLSVGYFFNETMAVELAAGYFSGREINKTKAETDSFGAEGFSKAGVRTFYLNPTFVVRPDSYSTVLYYIKVGAFLGLTNKGTYEDKYKYHILGDEDLFVDDVTHYSGKMSVGGTVTAGLDFMVTERFAPFAEIFTRISFWNPARYSEDITVMQYSSTSFIHEKTIYNINGALSTSAFGLNIGVRYYLFDY